jgi:hypothetical protein
MQGRLDTSLHKIRDLFGILYSLCFCLLLYKAGLLRRLLFGCPDFCYALLRGSPWTPDYPEHNKTSSSIRSILPIQNRKASTAATAIQFEIGEYDSTSIGLHSLLLLSSSLLGLLRVTFGGSATTTGFGVC